jgi:hypothetical protein
MVRAEVYTLRAASDAGTVKIVIDGAALQESIMGAAQRRSVL